MEVHVKIYLIPVLLFQDFNYDFICPIRLFLPLLQLHAQ